jgi:methylated-DNA-[protein]-cysteine S-methyltransferase
MPFHLRHLKTDFGVLYLVASDLGLRGVQWIEPKLPASTIKVRSLARLHLENAIHQIKEYLKGARSEFELPLDLEGTDFQLKVWKALCEIPYGQTLSYQQIARNVGNARAVRAVGMANKRNPVPIVIPCHRVIHSSGDLGGYVGGVKIKAALLQLEKSRFARALKTKPLVEMPLQGP